MTKISQLRESVAIASLIAGLVLIFGLAGSGDYADAVGLSWTPFNLKTLALTAVAFVLFLVGCLLPPKKH